MSPVVKGTKLDANERYCQADDHVFHERRDNRVLTAADIELQGSD